MRGFRCATDRSANSWQGDSLFKYSSRSLNHDCKMRPFVKLALFFLLLTTITSLAALGTATVFADADQPTAQLSIVVAPVSHLSDCVQMSEVARGDSIPFLINVTYTATGKVMSNGTVEVHVGNSPTLKARFSAGSKLWAVVYNVPWNHPTGPLSYFVTARSADGAQGLWRPINPYGFITVVPASLHVSVATVDAKTNKPAYAASTGDTIKIIATVALPLPGEGFPTQSKDGSPDVAGSGQTLNGTTAAKVQAVIGQGTFNATTGTFSNYTASTATLSYDPASSKWVGSYTFKQDDPSGLYTVVVLAADRVSQPNIGYSTGNSLTLGARSAGGVDSVTVYVASFGMIVLGFVAGLVVISKFALPKH